MNGKKGRERADAPRDARLVVRLTARELADVQAEAERRGESVSTLVRRALLLIAPRKT